MLISVAKKYCWRMLDIYFELAIFLQKKHLFISLSPNCKIKIAYVWTGPYWWKNQNITWSFQNLEKIIDGIRSWFFPLFLRGNLIEPVQRGCLFCWALRRLLRMAERSRQNSRSMFARRLPAESFSSSRRPECQQQDVAFWRTDTFLFTFY